MSSPRAISPTLGQMKAEYEAEMKIGDAIKAATMAQFESDIATLHALQGPECSGARARRRS